MEHNNFTIIKTYLRDIRQFFSKTLELLPEGEEKTFEQKSDIFIKVRETDIPFMFIVDMHVDIYENKDEQEEFHIKLIFSSEVKLRETKMRKDTMARILKKEVPTMMFGFVQESAAVITSLYGFPPIKLDRGELKFRKTSLDLASSLGVGLEPKLGYKWIIHDILSSEEGASFLDTLVRACGNTCLNYTESPLYRYYYRFLKPIKYNHPELSECDEKFWDMLFQFIVGESDKVNIFEGENGCPEVEFSFQNIFEQKKVSEMTLEEIRELTSALGIEAFTNTMITLYRWDFNDEYGKTLKDSEPPLEAELKKLYNYNSQNTEINEESVIAEDMELINHIFARIKEYDDKTFEFRLLNK